MTQKTNEELAREASNSEGSNATPDLFGLSQIDRYTALVEQRLLAKLLEGVELKNSASDHDNGKGQRWMLDAIKQAKEAL